MNWDDYQVDRDGDGDVTSAEDLDQDRTHNDVNEITGITEEADPLQWVWADPVWSARGNMTTAPQDLDAKYGHVRGALVLIGTGACGNRSQPAAAIVASLSLRSL